MTPIFLTLTLCAPGSLACDTVSIGPMTQAECAALNPQVEAVFYLAKHTEYAGYRLTGRKCGRREGSA